MADSGVKGAPKRKNFGKKGPFNKKAKVENGSAKGPKAQFKQKSPAINKQKPFNKNNVKQVNPDSPIKKKPFPGTGQLKNKVITGKIEKKSPNQESKERKKRSHFSSIKSEATEKAGKKDPELLKKLEDKIKTIESRGKLSKTAKRKIALLKKLKGIVDGSSTFDPKPKLAAQLKNQKKNVKGPVKPKGNKAGKTNAKQVAVKEEEDESDSDNEMDQNNDSDASSAEEEEEGDEGSEEGSAGEEEKSEEEKSEEEDGESEDDDDEDESEEETPVVKVGKKKIKPNKK